MQVLHREVNLAHSSMQHSATVSPAGQKQLVSKQKLETGCIHPLTQPPARSASMHGKNDPDIHTQAMRSRHNTLIFVEPRNKPDRII